MYRVSVSVTRFVHCLPPSLKPNSFSRRDPDPFSRRVARVRTHERTYARTTNTSVCARQPPRNGGKRTKKINDKYATKSRKLGPKRRSMERAQHSGNRRWRRRRRRRRLAPTRAARTHRNVGQKRLHLRTTDNKKYKFDDGPSYLLFASRHLIRLSFMWQNDMSAITNRLQRPTNACGCCEAAAAALTRTLDLSHGRAA